MFSTLQPDDVYYCGLKYIKDDVILNEPSADAPAARYQTIEENIKIFEEDEVEFISVPVPEFADSDPANIVHDFNKVSLSVSRIVDSIGLSRVFAVLIFAKFFYLGFSWYLRERMGRVGDSEHVSCASTGEAETGGPKL